MTGKIKIGISSCLLGKQVRYDAKHKKDQHLIDTLGKDVEWVPVCPEVEYGLPVPREKMRLTGDPRSPRLVTIKTGIDHTEGMLKWTESRLKELEKEDLCGFIFKSKSPSSGYKGVKVYSPKGIRSGSGLFAAAFMRYFPLIPVEDEVNLQNPMIMENFKRRVLVMKCWKDFLEKNK
jgi:uncharacterized protein YbbK (DUF523 family)